MAPDLARASARFTATVDLPTPPLPLATAMVCFTPGIGAFAGIDLAFGASTSVSTDTSETPGMEATAFMALVSASFLCEQAVPVNTILKLTLPPSIFKSLIILSVTRSLPWSGSMTPLSAAKTISSVILCDNADLHIMPEQAQATGDACWRLLL